MGGFRRFLGSFRNRLLLAFALVVTVALLLVLISLPRLLDSYFAQQDQQNLESRADLTLALVTQQIDAFTNQNPDIQRPILNLTDPPTPSDALYRALERGFVEDLARNQALADVDVWVSPSEADPEPVYHYAATLDEDDGQPGQTREPLVTTRTRTLPDCYSEPDCEGAVERLITVRLANPFTNREQTTTTIVSVLIVAAVIALVVAAVAALLLTRWLTRPVRRLTNASRALAEGHLDTRVPATEAGSPELAELGNAFNNMAERLQQSIQIISEDRDRSREFVADVSHELRTPIAALRTFNELLRDGAAEDPATREEFLEQSAKQLDRLDWLATNLLELSKLDSGLVALDLRPDDLRAVVENAVQHAEPVAMRKGVELLMHLPDEAVRQPHDPPRIGQVLSNLIGNAIKFTAPGGRIDVDLEPTAEGASISVTDTGEGIPPDELPHVFERFWRGSHNPQQRAIGSGLGLSIVKSIVDIHEGTVSIQSAVGVGTRVKVDLPASISVSSPSPAHG
jgi:signal transduction histidine kinase